MGTFLHTGVCSESLFDSQVVPGPQDPVLRHRPLLVLCHDRVRQVWIPHGWILLQGKHCLVVGVDVMHGQKIYTFTKLYIGRCVKYYVCLYVLYHTCIGAPPPPPPPPTYTHTHTHTHPSISCLPYHYRMAHV